MKKSFWLLSAGVAAYASPAYAQTDPSDEVSNTTGTEQAAVDEDADDEAIVITAQGRNQLLQDVPLAVQAVGAEQLQNSGASDIRALNQLAPSLLVSSTGSEANGSARIRGIGTVGDNPGLESSVAVFVDGVYRSRSGIGLNELGEIERIEVLRGPQGTLFGRNASAGLIHIISRRPNLNEFEAMGAITYGNYDHIRVEGAVSGPIGESGFGYRVDGVYSRRDGFYNDINNDTTVNNRNRFFVRGQFLWEPTDALSLRLIGDYTKRDERCCAAVYIGRDFNPLIGDLNERASPINSTTGNNIINVLQDLGAPAIAFNNPFSRNIYVNAGRSYQGDTEDKGVSLQADWDLGAATLTSITAYREYDSDAGSDTDYGPIDILYRAADGNSERSFETFTQELRLQGSAFGGKLDWLVGGFFANEDLTVTDNLRFGAQYGRFASCRLVSGALGALYSPGSPACLAARPALFGAASPLVYAAFDRLDSINDRGSTLDLYSQNSRNYAFFTHNIFHITDELALTVGARYTHERKTFDALFGNDNTACAANQAALVPFLTNPALAAVAGNLIGLSCQGNSTSELNGVSINDRRTESEWTGTGVLSYQPTPDWLFYASYSRGYKSGGFNLDRSALKSPILPFAATPGGAQGLVGNLQFDPEINNAYELGIKYSRGPITLNAVLFRQEFRNFQLNTFNGTVFIVQTVNGCTTDLLGADRDLSAATGTCAQDDIGWGVRSEGVELEAALRVHRDVNLTAGLTLADTEYRENLVGNRLGAPLDPALRKLPGDNLSNAPKVVFTGSFAWTPDIGNSGLSGLFYVDTRVTDDYNTGSDLFPQKEQDAYAIVNARIGIRGPDERWSIEAWAQNLFNVDYTQVAFNSPFQAGVGAAPFADPQFPGGRQIFSAYLAEPRTYGLTGRFRF